MATSCDEVTQFRQQRDIGPVYSHAFAEDSDAADRRGPHVAAQAATPDYQPLLEITRAQPVREDVLARLFATFDTDNTGALDHQQFQRCFALVSSDVSLGVQEWHEVCTQLGVDAAVGLPRGPDMFDQFFSDLDDRGLRIVNQRLLELAECAVACPTCGNRPNKAGGAAAVYCDDRQRARLQAQGCLCERLERRHGDDTLEGTGDYAGRRLMDLYHNHAPVVRQLVQQLRELTKSR